MIIYEWNCPKCEVKFETLQSIVEYNGETQCPTCGDITKERIFSAKITILGSSVQNAEYNPAFGQVVKNKAHRNELAKQKGLIEIGNDKPESIHKATEETKRDRIKKSWENI